MKRGIVDQIGQVKKPYVYGKTIIWDTITVNFN